MQMCRHLHAAHMSRRAYKCTSTQACSSSAHLQLAWAGSCRLLQRLHNLRAVCAATPLCVRKEAHDALAASALRQPHLPQLDDLRITQGEVHGWSQPYMVTAVHNLALPSCCSFSMTCTAQQNRHGSGTILF